MKSKRAIWILPVAVMALLAFAFSSFAQTREVGALEREGRPSIDSGRRDVAPLDSRGETPVIPPAATIMERSLDGGGLPPVEPGHVMDTESEDIYIYVTLMAPPGPPPPESVIITLVNCTPGAEQIRFKANAAPFAYGADWYNVYRDTTALFYMAQLDSNNLLPDRTTSLYFNDNFNDTLWALYMASSKGVCDTIVNLFYVFTSVDTGPGVPGGMVESPYPSWCLAEYDQGIKRNPTVGSANIVSIPCYDDDIVIASNFATWGATAVQEWNAATQTWGVVGSQLVPGVWAPNNAVRVSHTYRITGNSIPTTGLFSTFEPGIVPEEDTTYILYSNSTLGDRNIVMVPFKVSYFDGINNCASLEASIVSVGATNVYRVDRWNNATMTWSIVGSKVGPMWLPNGRIRPGLPYRVFVSTPAPVIWPYGS